MTFVGLLLWLNEMGYLIIESDVVHLINSEGPTSCFKLVVYKHRGRHTFYL